MRITLQTKAKTSASPSSTFAPVRSGLLQRKCACGGTPGPSGECDACRKKRLQRKGDGARAGTQNASTIPPIVHEVLRSPGQPLDAETRAFMELRFGHDFGNVRVHNDAKAAESAQVVDALAYTVGDDAVFGAHQYAPQTNEGQRLLAHELTHVLQQRRHQPGFLQPMGAGFVAEAAEREADQIAAQISAAGPKEIADVNAVPGRSLQRKCSGAKGGCTDGKWKYEYDGCSVPARLLKNRLLNVDKDNPAGGKDTHFATCLPSHKGGRACDRHDECYQTCNPLGKSFCDAQILADMLFVCAKSSENAQLKATCVGWATTYYEGLILGGDLAFWERQLQVCRCPTPNTLEKADRPLTPAVSTAVAARVKPERLLKQ
jgi:hypothetical protein